MKDLFIGHSYTDKALGELIYLGRIGYELPLGDGIKGANIFRIMSRRTFSTVWLTKREIIELKSL